MVVHAIYLQPGTMVFDTLLDLMELQKGIETLNEHIDGKLYYETTLYGITWEIKFKITEIDRSRCAVNITVESLDDNEDTDVYAEIMIRREYALLDSLLLIGTPNDVSIK